MANESKFPRTIFSQEVLQQSRQTFVPCKSPLSTIRRNPSPRLDDNSLATRKLERNSVENRSHSTQPLDNRDRSSNPLEEAGADKAQLIIASMRRLTDARKVLSFVKDIPIFVRVFEDGDAEVIRKLGGTPISNSEAAVEQFQKWFDGRFPKGVG